MHLLHEEQKLNCYEKTYYKLLDRRMLLLQIQKKNVSAIRSLSSLSFYLFFLMLMKMCLVMFLCIYILYLIKNYKCSYNQIFNLDSMNLPTTSLEAKLENIYNFRYVDLIMMNQNNEHKCIKKI